MRIVFASVLAWTVAAPGAAHAQTIALQALLEEARARNPEIAAAERQFDAARQRPAQERSLPDPTVGIGYASAGNPLPGAGLGTEPTANIGIEVTQALPYPGKLGLRAAMAGKEADAQGRQAEAVRLSVAARVKQAYFALAFTYAADDVLARNRQLLDTLLKVTESRYGVGGAAQQDVFKAQTEVSVIELRQEQVRRERAVREAELNALLNRAPGTPLGRPAPLHTPRFDVALDSLLAAARENAPMLRREQAMVERGQVALDAAHREYKPDFALTGGYFNQGSMPSMYMFRFDVVVPLRRARRAAAVAEQTSLLAAARQTLDAARTGLEARVQEDYRMAVTSLRLATLYDATVLPQSRLALESSMASYQTGAVEFLSLLTNFTSILEFEMTYYEELTAFFTAASRLEEMTGLPLVQ
jgi:outer membrane protein TolC